MDTTTIRVEVGARPWALTERGTEPIEVLHYYDMPLAGLVRQGEQTIAYRCVIGQTDNLHLWHYTVVDNVDLARVEAAEGPDDLDDVLSVFSGRPGKLALASDRLQVIAVSDVVPAVNAGETVRALYDELDRILDQAKRQSIEQRRSATDLTFA